MKKSELFAIVLFWGGMVATLGIGYLAGFLTGRYAWIVDQWVTAPTLGP